MTRISVAMATRNGERFISEQLESIARQSWRPHELVISDDASTDSTVGIAERFAAQAEFPVMVTQNDQPIGFGDNFFRAMSFCDGELLALCDQDDVWHEDKLARCVRPFEVDPRVSLVVHSARVVDAGLRSLDWSNPDIRRRRTYRAGSLPPFSGFSGFALMFRSAFAVGGDVDHRPPGFFDGEGARMEHGVWANLVGGALGDVVLLPDVLALYRRHESNASVVGRDLKDSRMRQSLALREEHEYFRRTAEAVRERASYLERLRPLADALGPPAKTGLQRALASYGRYANAMEQRATAYSQRGAAARALRITGRALRGDYRSRLRGGLGTASLARDLTVGLRPPSHGRRES